MAKEKGKDKPENPCVKGACDPSRCPDAANCSEGKKS